MKWKIYQNLAHLRLKGFIAGRGSKRGPGPDLGSINILIGGCLVPSEFIYNTIRNLFFK